MVSGLRFILLGSFWGSSANFPNLGFLSSRLNSNIWLVLLAVASTIFFWASRVLRISTSR